MAQLLEFLKMAFDNIKANKGRSILTMLGIIIGISSVIMIISVGTGAKSQISDELNAMGSGQIYVYVDESAKKEDIIITEEDFQAIKEKVPHVKGVTTQYSFYGSAISSKGSFDAMVTGGNSDLQYFSKNTMKRGRFFNEGDSLSGRQVCVITSTDAKKMFGTDDVVGLSIDLTLYNVTKEYTIVGVEDSKSADMLASMMSTRMEIKVPLSSIETAFGFYFELTDVMIASESPEYSADVAKRAISLLEARHNARGEGLFIMQSFDDQMSSITSMLNTITYFIVFVAAISLLVGGIGVMNIMLVSVTERTREIGIRKALGARTNSILLQFISESAIITLIGGIIGIILGIMGAFGICGLLGFKPGISIMTIFMATLFSSAVGIFFGIYPAKKAAKMRPIDALRYN